MRSVNSIVVAMVVVLGLSTQAIASYLDVVLSDRPVAYWRLGELTGNPAYDSSGNGHNASFSGVTLGMQGAIEGDTDTSVLFDASDMIQADSTALMPNYDSWSVEAWVKVAGTGRFMPVVSWYPGGYLWGHNSSYILGITEQGVPSFYIRDVNENSVSIQGTSPITDSLWHHLVAVLDRQEGNIRLYVDGKEVALGPIAVMGLVTDASGIPVNVGGQDRYWSEPWSFTGAMDEVAIYRGVLSAERVLFHNQAGRGLASDMDADADGVPDGLDKCAATPPGAVVDGNGCISQCPSQPSREEIEIEVGKALAAQSASLAEKDAVISSLRADLASVTATVSSKEQTIAALQAHIAVLEAAISASQSAIAGLNATISDLQQQATTLPTNLSLIFGDPAFVLPGATLTEQIASLTSAIGKMPQGQIKKLQELLVR